MRYFACFFVITSLFLPFSAQAAVVAVVDMQRVMGDANAAKSARTQLETKQKTFQSEVAKTEADLQQKDQELAKQRSLLSADEFKNKLTTFRKQAADAQKDVQQKRLKLRRAFEMSIVTIQKQVTSIVAGIAKEKNYEIVVPSAQTIFYKPELDITTEVLNRLNTQLPSMKVDFGN